MNNTDVVHEDDKENIFNDENSPVKANIADATPEAVIEEPAAISPNFSEPEEKDTSSLPKHQEETFVNSVPSSSAKTSLEDMSPGAINDNELVNKTTRDPKESDLMKKETEDTRAKVETTISQESKNDSAKVVTDTKMADLDVSPKNSPKDAKKDSPKPKVSKISTDVSRKVDTKTTIKRSSVDTGAKSRETGKRGGKEAPPAGRVVKRRVTSDDKKPGKEATRQRTKISSRDTDKVNRAQSKVTISDVIQIYHRLDALQKIYYLTRLR